MKTSELAKLGFEYLQDRFEDGELAGGYTSDLLSDVMANLKDRQVLITIHAHKNTIAVASLADKVIELGIIKCNAAADKVVHDGSA